MTRESTGREVTVVTSSDGFEALAAEWRALVANHATDLQLFQDYTWNRTWWKHFGDARDLALRIVTGREAGRLVLVWPLLLRRAGAVRILEQIGGLLSCYDDVLIHAGVDQQVWLENAWQHLGAMTDVDVIRLRAVRQGSTLAEFARRKAGNPIDTTSAPFVDCRAFPNFDDYLASRSKKMRKTQRRSERLLQGQGEVEHITDASFLTPSAAIDKALEFKSEWLAARGLSGKDLLTASGRAFLAETCTRYAKGDETAELHVSLLQIDDRVIAIGIGVDFKRRHYEYLGAFDYRLERAGPGRVRMAAEIRDCFGRGITAYDMLTPATEFKSIWTDAQPAVHQYVVARSWRGRLFRDVYLRRLRPRLKAIYKGLSRLRTRFRAP